MKRSLCHPSKMHSQGSFAHFYRNSNSSAASCIEKLTQSFYSFETDLKISSIQRVMVILVHMSVGPLIFRAIFIYLFCQLISLDSLALVFRFNILGSFLHSSPCLNLILQNKPKLHAITLVCTHNCSTSKYQLSTK